jgi:hypothetical protein
MPRPRVLSLTAQVVVGSSLLLELEQDDLDLARIEGWLEEAKREGVRLDAAGLGYAFGRGMERRMRAFAGSPDDFDLLARVELDQRVFARLPFDADRRQVQNLYYGLLQEVLPGARARADRGDAEAAAWVARFTALGRDLTVRVG